MRNNYLNKAEIASFTSIIDTRTHLTNEKRASYRKCEFRKHTGKVKQEQITPMPTQIHGSRGLDVTRPELCSDGEVIRCVADAQMRGQIIGSKE